MLVYKAWKLSEDEYTVVKKEMNMVSNQTQVGCGIWLTLGW